MSLMSDERRSLINIERGIQGYRDADGNVYITGITTSALISQYRRAKQESRGFCDFFLVFVGILFSSVFLTVGWVTGLIMPICMIAIGAIYIDNCPEEQMVPILLLVGGALIVILYALEWVQNCGGENSGIPTIPCCCLVNLLNFFLIAWLIADSVFVYRTYKSNFDDIRCNRVLYTFSFWLLNILYVFVGVIFLIMFCGMCMYFTGD